MDPGQNEPRGEEASRPVGDASFDDGEIYPPSEDTFLLADYLEALDSEDTALEIGVGNGYLTRILSKKISYVVGTDISLAAIHHIKEKLRQENIWNVDLVVTDIASPFRPEGYKLVVSNPPYLPCMYEEEPLWCGGPTGIEFTLRLISQTVSVLKGEGRVLLVASSLSDVGRLTTTLMELFQQVGVVGTRGVSLFEKLFILECSHKRVQGI
ncbi:MAG: HemK2/MTQ2 family protein methyltransferase [Infirmifilum sp.]